MRVLILTQHYDPEPIPKPGELARALRARGHEVHVVAGLPNYPEGTLYPGFHLTLFQRETLEGVPILRVFVYPYHGRSAIRRIVNYLSFMVSAVLAVGLTPPCDVIYVLHPPLTIAIPAWIISTLKRAPFVYDVQDIWPESVLETGMLSSPPIMRLMDGVGRWIYRRAAGVLAITRPARQRLIEKGAAPERTVVPLLWVTDSLFRPPDRTRNIRREFDLEGRFVVMYAGNLGVVQKLDTLIEAAARVAGDPRILLVLVGDGMDRQRLERLVSSHGLTNVRFLGRQPFSTMPDFQSAADVLLVHLKLTPITEFLVPAKVLMYLTTGRPVLLAMEGPAADLVRRADAGVIVPSENPEALADAVVRMSQLSPAVLDRMGANGRDHLLAHNSPRQVIDQYERLLLSAAEYPKALASEPVAPC